MIDSFTSNHFADHNDNPAGGHTSGVGLCIAWQNGPLGRGADRKEPNGAFVETVIAAARDRIEFYQASQFNCIENAEAIAHLDSALQILNFRTARRESEGSEGTHVK